MVLSDILMTSIVLMNVKLTMSLQLWMLLIKPTNGILREIWSKMRIEWNFIIRVQIMRHMFF